MGEVTHVQDPVLKYARSLGWITRRVQYISRNGCPDSWCFRNGNVVIIEFKDVDGTLQLRQEREIGRLRNAGMTVHVIDTYEAGCAIFDEYESI